MLTLILKNTPAWVFVLFFALLALGYVQSRDRTVSRSRAAITPAALIALSLYGVLSAFSFFGLAFWLAGAAAAASLGVLFSGQRNVRYSPATKSFFVPGSWVPLALMMAIFFTKYAVAVAQARHLPVVNQAAVIVATSVCYGVFSGVFFARAAVLWRLVLAAARG